jgi:hypothetical protein
MLLEMLSGILIVMRGLQQGLRRDAADIEASAAGRATAVDAGGIEAELGGANRGHISAGTGAYHDDVEAAVSHSSNSFSENFHHEDTKDTKKRWASPCFLIFGPSW